MVIETSFVEGRTPLVLECMLDIKNVFSQQSKQALYCTLIFLKRTSPRPQWNQFDRV